MSRSEDLLPIVNLAPVIPVVVLEDASQAVPLARALVAGGLRAIEITLANASRYRRDRVHRVRGRRRDRRRRNGAFAKAS